MELAQKTLPVQFYSKGNTVRWECVRSYRAVIGVCKEW